MVKKSELTKLLSTLLCSVSILSIAPLSAQAELKQDSSGVKFIADNFYTTGWQKIDDKWYYFNESGEDRGYMAANKLVDNFNYYVDADGVWQNTPCEIYQYSKLLKDTEMLKQYDVDFNTAADLNNHIIDIDNDGIYEMILEHGTCESDKAITVFKYYNSKIFSDKINIPHSSYRGYSISDKQFLVKGMQNGYLWAGAYSLQDDKCILVDEVVGSPDGKYTLNNKDISEKDLNETFFNKFK